MNENELNAKINELQAQAATLVGELRIYEGRIANRNPALAAKLKTENLVLTKRIAALEKALLAISLDVLKPRINDDAKLQYEILRQAAVEFCKKTNTDPEIWKNIAS